MNYNFSIFKKVVFTILVFVGVAIMALPKAAAQTGGESYQMVRIQDYGDQARYLRINDDALEWSLNDDAFSLWYEIPVAGASNDFFYKNVATGEFIYREAKGFGNITTTVETQGKFNLTLYALRAEGDRADEGSTMPTLEDKENVYIKKVNFDEFDRWRGGGIRDWLNAISGRYHDVHNVGARFEGWFTPEETGEYIFWASSDCGVKLTIDDEVVIDAFRFWWEYNAYGKIELTANVAVKFQLDYGNGWGGSSINIRVNTPLMERDDWDDELIKEIPEQIEGSWDPYKENPDESVDWRHLNAEEFFIYEDKWIPVDWQHTKILLSENLEGMDNPNVFSATFYTLADGGPGNAQEQGTTMRSLEDAETIFKSAKFDEFFRWRDQTNIGDWLFQQTGRTEGSDIQNVGVRFEGWFTPAESGEYIFWASGDDGIKLTIDGKVVIDAYRFWWEYDVYGKIELTAGEPVYFQFDFGQGFGGAYIRLKVNTPSMERDDWDDALIETIPEEVGGCCWGDYHKKPDESVAWRFLEADEFFTGSDAYIFRKLASDLDDGLWLVNLENANFDDGKPAENEAFVLSGINKNETLTTWDDEYPAALMHTMPVLTNAETTVSFIKYFEITLNINEEDGGAVTGNGIYKDGDEATIEAIAETDWKFVNWTDKDGIAVSTEAEYKFNVTENMTLTANFVPDNVNIYTITVVANPTAGGTVSITGSGQYQEDDEVTVEANANSGYRFINWTDAGSELSNEAEYTFNATKDVQLTANFELIPVYEVTLLANPTEGGTVTGAGSYETDNEVTVNAIANGGWRFLNWTDDGNNELSTEAAYKFIVTEDITLTANFVEKEAAQVKSVRIQDYGDNNLDARYLRVNNNQLEWSTMEDDRSLWYEMPAGSNDFFYKNVATGEYLNRGDKGFGDGEMETIVTPGHVLATVYALDGPFGELNSGGIGPASDYEGKTMFYLEDTDEILNIFNFNEFGKWGNENIEQWMKDISGRFSGFINVGVRFEGWFTPKETGYYIFWGNGDDGIKLTIDGEVVFDAYRAWWEFNAYGKIELDADIPVYFQLDFCQGWGGAHIDLKVNTPSMERTDWDDALIKEIPERIEGSWDPYKEQPASSVEWRHLNAEEFYMEEEKEIYIDWQHTKALLKDAEDDIEATLLATFYALENTGEGSTMLNFEHADEILKMVQFDELNRWRNENIVGWVVQQTGRTGDQYVGVRFEGWFTPEETGEYIFWTNGDDGMKLTIDGTVVIDAYRFWWDYNVFGKINLTANVPVYFQLDWGQGHGGAYINLRMNTPSMDRTGWDDALIEIIPESVGSCCWDDYKKSPEATVEWRPLNAEEFFIDKENFVIGNAAYTFRKVETEWENGNRIWLVNMKNAKFDDGKPADYEAFVLSGANKDVTLTDWDEDYPVALMHTLPETDNIWSSVKVYYIYELALLVKNDEGGTVSGGGTFKGGDEVTVEATAEEGWVFLFWTDESGKTVSSDSEYTFTINSDLVLTANFAIAADYIVTLNVNNAEGGAVTGDGEYKAAQQATVTATANTGWKFVNWTDGATEVSTDAEYTFIVTGDVTLTANFALIGTYKVTLVANPTAGGTLTGAGDYLEGTIVTVVATANTGYKFVNWRGANNAVVSTEAEYTFTLAEEDVTLTANFDVEQVNSVELVSVNPLCVWNSNGLLHVTGLTVGEVWSVYNATGTLVYRDIAQSEEADVAPSVKGMYIIQAGDRTIKVVFE